MKILTLPYRKGYKDSLIHWEALASPVCPWKVTSWVMVDCTLTKGSQLPFLILCFVLTKPESFPQAPDLELCVPLSSNTDTKSGTWLPCQFLLGISQPQWDLIAVRPNGYFPMLVQHPLQRFCLSLLAFFSLEKKKPFFSVLFDLPVLSDLTVIAFSLLQ